MSNKNKKQNGISTWLFAINILLIILFLIFIFSLYFTVTDISSSTFSYTKVGFEYLMKQFEISIKIGAAIITIITVKIYFSRINQTEKIIQNSNAQIESYKKSENLKNYFLHRKEFRNYLQELDFFKKDDIEFYSVWDKLYRTFYSTSHKDFSHELNTETKKAILGYLNTIKSSTFNSRIVPAFEENTLNELATNILPPIREIIFNVAENQLSKFLDRVLDNHPDTKEINILSLLLKIKISKKMYESILSFDGENMIHSNVFDNNINEFIINFKSKYNEN